MDTRRVTSLEITSQSVGTKEICILVVHDDPIYRNVMAEMLQHCNQYEVLKFERISTALNAIREKKDRLNLVITDVHQSNTNGFEILYCIEKEFNLLVISMLPHENAKPVSIGLDSGAKLYFVKSLSVNDFKTLWQYANAKERGKTTTSPQRASVLPENVVEASLGNTSSFHEVTRGFKKRSKETHEQNEVATDDSPNEKKQRVVWTDLMHRKFLEAIEQLGYERAFPKKIVEVMNVPGLTRENVASHLQKFRMCMKRAQEGLQSPGSICGINLTSHAKETFFPSSHSALNLNSCLLHSDASTSTSNWGHQYRHNVSSLDAIARNNANLLDFGTSQLTSQIGSAQVDSGHVPGGLVRSNINSRTILSGIESGGSSSNPNRASSSCTSSTYVGYRLSGDGKSVESGPMGGVSGNDENRTDKANLSAEGSGNESLVQFPSTSIDYIPQQQPSLAGNGKLVESGQMGVLGNDENRMDKANLSAEGSGNESLVQYPSTSIDNIPQQQPSLACNGKSVESGQMGGVSGNDKNRTNKANSSAEGSGNESLVQYSSTSIDYIPQQQPSLAGNGKSVESGQMGSVSGNDKNRTNMVNLCAEGSGNESLVQYPSMSINDIPQQQPSLPPFPPILVDFDSFGAEGEMDVLLNATGSASSQIFWNSDFDDTLFNYTD